MNEEKNASKIKFLTEHKHEMQGFDGPSGFHVLVETTSTEGSKSDDFKTMIWFEATGQDTYEKHEIRIEGLATGLPCTSLKIASDGVAFAESPSRFNVGVWGRLGSLTLAAAFRDAADAIEHHLKVQDNEVKVTSTDRMSITGF